MVDVFSYSAITPLVPKTTSTYFFSCVLCELIVGNALKSNDDGIFFSILNDCPIVVVLKTILGIEVLLTC